MSTGNGKMTRIYWFYAGNDWDHIVWKNSSGCASMDFGKGLERSEPWGDSRWSRWGKETMKTGIGIQKFSEKKLLHLQFVITNSLQSLVCTVTSRTSLS